MKHAHEPRRLVARDILKFEEDNPEFEREVNDYFKIFAAPVYEGEGDKARQVCFHCGSPFDPFGQALGIAAAMRWGLAHGEARCTGMHDRPCGWPYRGMHYAKDAGGNELFTLRNVFLAYHPDEVTERKPGEAA